MKQTILNQLEQNITVPHVGYYYQTPLGGRFTYHTHGQIRYIHITQDEQGAFAKKHGLIDFYSCENGSMKLYKTRFVIKICPADRQPVFEQVNDRIFWQDLTFTQSQVIHFAAVHEYERAAATMNLGAKVIHLFTSIKNKAA